MNTNSQGRHRHCACPYKRTARGRRTASPGKSCKLAKQRARPIEKQRHQPIRSPDFRIRVYPSSDENRAILHSGSLPIQWNAMLSIAPGVYAPIPHLHIYCHLLALEIELYHHNTRNALFLSSSKYMPQGITHLIDKQGVAGKIPHPHVFCHLCTRR